MGGPTLISANVQSRKIIQIAQVSFWGFHKVNLFFANKFMELCIVFCVLFINVLLKK